MLTSESYRAKNPAYKLNIALENVAGEDIIHYIMIMCFDNSLFKKRLCKGYAECTDFI